MTLRYRETPAWDAGARTIAALVNNGAFSFKVEDPIGVVCGLNDNNYSANHIEIDYAFFIDSRNYRIIEKGDIKSREFPSVSDATYKIERLNEVVRYFVNDKLIYTSLLPSAGLVFGDCSLYAYLDRITNACIIDYDTDIPGTESEIPAALILQIETVKDLIQTGPSILENIDEYLQEIVNLVQSVEALLTGDPITLIGVEELWDSVLDIIELLLEDYSDFYLVNQLYFLINQVNDIIKNGLNLSDVDDILNLTQEILDLINNKDQSIIDEINSIWDGITVYMDELETQNGSSTFFEALNALVAQVNYLLSIGEINSPAILALINAILALISLGDESLLNDLAVGSASLGPVGATGSDASVNIGYIGIGPVFIAGTEADINRGTVFIGTISAVGVQGDVNWGDTNIGPVNVWGQEETESLIPEYNAGQVYLGPFITSGYEGIIEVNNGTAVFGPLSAVGVEGDVVFGEAELGPIQAEGYSALRQYLFSEWPAWIFNNRQLIKNAYSELLIPSLALTSAGNDKDNAQVDLTLPALTLTTGLGATTTLNLPALAITTALTSEGFATVDVTLPTLTLTSLGYVGDVAASALTLPVPTLTAEMGAYASLEIVAPELVATATSIGIAQAALTFPFLELAATGDSRLATVVLELPTLELLSGPSRVELEIPLLILTAQATSDSAVAATTYAINLSTGAVTQLLLGEFDKLVIARGRLYGLQGTTLVRLDGDVDGVDTEIPATIRFAPQTFGTNQMKRLSDVYLDTREYEGVTLSVVADELTEWRYQTATDKAPAYGTHKVKVGRGVAFHTAGLILQNRNGGKLDIGAMELLVSPLSRKI